MTIKKIRSNENGQSMIEYILTLSFSLGVVFLFFTLAKNLTTGYLVHYVNFAASRAYLTYDGTRNTAIASIGAAGDVARDVFSKYNMESFGINSSDFNVIRPQTGAGNALMVGTTIQYENEISSFSLVGGNQNATFLTESFLGKEPTRKECFEMICQAMDLGSCGSTLDVALYDNGC